MSEHWSVAVLGEDRFGLDPYETIDLLREKLQMAQERLDVLEAVVVRLLLSPPDDVTREKIIQTTLEGINWNEGVHGRVFIPLSAPRPKNNTDHSGGN